MSNVCIDLCNCKSYCFGLFSCCEDIVLPFEVLQNGTHTLRVHKHGRIYYISATFVAGADEMSFPNHFNEDMDFEFQVIQPDLSLYEYTFEEETYCSYSAQVREFIDLSLESVPSCEDTADCASTECCNAYRAILDLVEGDNVIAHNLDLASPYTCIIELRDSVTGSKYEFRKVINSETANNVTINLTFAYQDVEVTVLR